MTGTVMPRAPERAHDAAVGEACKPFLGERWAQQVAAESLERRPIVSAHSAIGVEIEALEVRVTRADGPHPRRIGGATDAQDGRAGTVPEGRSPADGGGGEPRQHRRLVGEGIGCEIRRVVPPKRWIAVTVPLRPSTMPRRRPRRRSKPRSARV